MFLVCNYAELYGFCGGCRSAQPVRHLPLLSGEIELLREIESFEQSTCTDAGSFDFVNGKFSREVTVVMIFCLILDTVISMIEFKLFLGGKLSVQACMPPCSLLSTFRGEDSRV